MYVSLLSFLGPLYGVTTAQFSSPLQAKALQRLQEGLT
jgi:hypothetical protein